MYSAFGLSHIGPRILQLFFYILAAVYLYRTILLFREKETALLGATIYLFSPIIFASASRAAAESGAIFFIIIISFYFLRFIKNEENRDLILTSYFIGIGYLYKRGMLIMFLICFAYLVLNRIKKRDLGPIIHFKILLLSLVPILPWMKIGPHVPAVWSNLTVFDELMTYPLMLQSQLSQIGFFLFLISFIFILVARRDDLSFYFGILFIAFYCLFTVMVFGKWNHRYAMALYPAISVFLAQFVDSIAQRIRWKHAFKLLFSILTVYLIFLCLVPRSSSNLITYKYKDFEIQYYPWDKATEWIKKNTGKNDKILGIYFTSDYRFYLNRLYADKNEINQNRIVIYGYGDEESFYPMQNLKKLCYTENISYVMLRYGPNNFLPPARAFIVRMKMMKYLKENMDMDNEFFEIAKFNLEDNYIIVYKLKGNFINSY
jgi:hypothetical protein